MSNEKLDAPDDEGSEPPDLRLLELDTDFGAELGLEKDLPLLEPEEYVRLDPELGVRELDEPDE